MKQGSVGMNFNHKMEHTGRRLAWLMLALGLFAFIVRLIYIFKARDFDNMATDEMQRAAISFARDGYIGDIFVGSPGKSAHVAPLYPALLGCLYYIFGWDTISGRIAQGLAVTIATVITISLLPLIAEKVRLPAISGCVAGIFMALFPLNLWTETSGEWEQPFGALALLLLLWAFCNLHDEKWSRRRTVLLTGFLLGTTAYLSPSLLPAPAIMFIAEWITQRGRRIQVFRAGLVMAMVTLTMITPWMIRNYYALGGFVPMRSNFGLELAIGNNPQANGKTFISYADDPDSPAYNMHPNSSPKERARVAQLGELAYMKEKQRAAIQWVKENPRKSAELTLTRFRLFWFPPTDAWPRSSPYSLYKSLFFCLIGMWMFGELFELLLFRHPTRWLLFAAVVGPSLIYMITHSDPRYRYPVFGLSVLLACNFFFRALRFVRELTRTRIVTETA